MDIDEEEIFHPNNLGPVETDTLNALSHQGQRRLTKKSKKRRVSFPEDDKLVSKRVEPVDPWANGSNATSAEVIKAYINFCAKLKTKPIDKLVKQLKEHDAFDSRINILDLKGIKLDLKSCEALEEIFKRVQVNILDVENTNLEDEGAIALMEMIEFYQSALHICIGYNPRIKTRGWQIFSQMVRKVQFIEFIDVRHCCFNDPCSAVMARSLRLNTTLKILHLEGDNLSGKLLLILCTGIKFNQSISELFLGDNFLVPSDGGTLSAMLKSNTTLQLLDLRNNMLQDQGVLHLSDGLTQQKSGEGVKTLVLWNNQISRNGMIPMANLLAISPNIQTLNIGHNRLGNDGIRNLQIGLLKNRSLLRLGLLNTKLTAEGAVALAEYIADTRTLLRLDLRENDLFVGGLMALTLAVKINESVVRIDLDKDLKKEQGMEGTQTSLLVDIYQYLERNKKLGIEREELRRKELEKENSVNEVTSNEAVDDVTNDDVTNNDDAPNDDVTGISGDDVISENDVISKDDVTVVCSEGGESGDFVDSGGLQNHVDDQSSRFVVSLVDNDTKNFIKVDNEDDSKDLTGSLSIDDVLGSEKGEDEPKVDETSKLLNESDKNEEMTDPEEFDKELDELLANVSGVKIDLSDPPKADDTEEFWSKDMNEILESTAS